MSTKFWEEEEPESVETPWLKLQFYRRHGKLAITKKYQRDGAARFKTVYLDRRDFTNDPEIAQLFETVISDWKNKPVEGDGV
ncbi:MAG: hypothetical protein K6T65_17050 [Peptococcaceae bacterium]|nr:hypothetical protein [Peptococcaceae bacterium]